MAQESNDALYAKAIEAIMDLFEDTSASQGETRVSLESLIEEIEILLDTLEE